jgi:hypothetical protein
MRAIVATLALALLAQADSGDAIRDRLDGYLLDYERKLSTVIADEQMTQRDGASRSANRDVAEATKNRRIVSQVAFISLPANAGWLGFRRVVNVNGKAVNDGAAPFDVLLNEGPADDYDQARLLLAQSAEHNLGMPRTTNLPNLPLEFLHPRNRHRLHHRVDGRDKVRGVETTVLVFEEHSTPTIIQAAEGGDTLSLVTAWVEPATGRLMRAQVKTRDARIGVLPFDNVVRVEFREDAALGFLVPYEMREEFFAGRFREGTGTARYSNYRRFGP